jgi:chemotaxis response regulator CheB
MPSEEIRVLVVDDSAVVRSIIADSIAATPGMKVVGKAGDGWCWLTSFVRSPTHTGRSPV